MQINENVINILKKMKDNLDYYWELVPETSKFDNRFESRELRYSKYQTSELECYLVNENAFIAMCKQVFNLDTISLSEAYDMVENLLEKENTRN